MMQLFKYMKTRSVISSLRKMFPGRWRYNRDQRVWEHESGWHVYRCAALGPRYDGDDDTFELQYRRSDTRELIFL